MNVIGLGGHGLDIIEDLNAGEPPWTCCQVYDTDAMWAQRGAPTPAIVAINDPRLRRLVAEKHGIRDGVWVHRSAVIGPHVKFGEHVHVNAGATVTRTTLGKFTTVSPGATICGDVKVGESVTIGANATLCQFVTVGDGATIGAGAVIPPHTNIPAGETWVGVPAQAVR